MEGGGGSGLREASFRIWCPLLSDVSTAALTAGPLPCHSGPGVWPSIYIQPLWLSDGNIAHFQCPSVYSLSTAVSLEQPPPPPRRDSPTDTASWYSPLVWPLSHCASLVCVTNRIWQNCWMSLLRLSYKDTVACFSLSLSLLTHSGGEAILWAAPWRGLRWSPLPVVMWEPLEVYPAAPGLCPGTAALADSLPETLLETLNRNHSAKLLLDTQSSKAVRSSILIVLSCWVLVSFVTQH